MTKKWLTILAVFIGIAILAFVFSRIFRPPAPEEIPKEELPSPTSRAYLKAPQEVAEPKEIREIIIEEALKPILSSDGRSVLYFSKKDNKFYSVDINTLTKKSLSLRNFYNVMNLDWSSFRDQVFLSIYEEKEQKPIFYLYDFGTDQLTKLNEFINDVEWVLDDQRVIYVYTSYLKRSSLSSSNPDGSDWQRLIDLEGIYHPQLFASSNKKRIAIVSSICFEACDTDYDIRIYDLNTREFKQYTENAGCLDLKWSPDDSKILYTSSEIEDETGIPVYLLYLLDLRTKEIKNLEIESFAWKCVYAQDGKTLYCAVPREGTRREEERWVSEDVFWKINLEINERVQLTNFNPDLSIDATNLFLSLDEKVLFFTNTKDSKLYSLTLE